MHQPSLLSYSFSYSFFRKPYFPFVNANFSRVCFLYTPLLFINHYIIQQKPFISLKSFTFIQFSYEFLVYNYFIFVFNHIFIILRPILILPPFPHRFT
uniref:Uncharacterized protein n=1 Tax=Octopus bimaculoides TaxID=37653 RepID=A0A0L8GL08_OCTBM